MERLNSRKEQDLRNEIAGLQEQLSTERMVHDKIMNYIEKRRAEVNDAVEKREYKKESKQQELNDEKDKILEMKEEAYKETQKMEALC